MNLHLLRTAQRVKLQVLHGQALHYIGPLTRVGDLPGRPALCSTGSNRLYVPYVRLSTIGSRAFPVAGPQAWNNLPEHVTWSWPLQRGARWPDSRGGMWPSRRGGVVAVVLRYTCQDR